MDDKDTESLLIWLQKHSHSARRWMDVSNFVASALVLMSIFASFAASVAAANISASNLSAKIWLSVLGGLPAVFLTILKQLPFREWARFQNRRYIAYREIYFLLKYRKIDLSAAVKMVNDAGHELQVAGEAVPPSDFAESVDSRGKRRASFIENI